MNVKMNSGWISFSHREWEVLGMISRFWFEQLQRWGTMEGEQIRGIRSDRELIMLCANLQKPRNIHAKLFNGLGDKQVDITDMLMCLQPWLWMNRQWEEELNRVRRAGNKSWEKGHHLGMRWKRCVWRKHENGWLEGMRKVRRLLCVRYQKRSVSHGAKATERSSKIKIKWSPSGLATEGHRWL